MTWYVDRDGVVGTKPCHVAFEHRHLAEALAIEITAIRNRTLIIQHKLKTPQEREVAEINGELWVGLAMEEAELARDAPLMEAYADQLMRKS